MRVWVVGGCKNSLRNAAGEKNVRQNLLDLAMSSPFGSVHECATKGATARRFGGGRLPVKSNSIIQIQRVVVMISSHLQNNEGNPQRW